MHQQTHYVFGPVPSRRLGNSLGVDLVTFKACSFDCVYCQLGRTTEQTLERRRFVPPEAVLGEVEAALGSGAAVDYVTLSGSGEPTLSSDLGRVLADIKAVTAVPAAVLTNGSLLWREDVCGELERDPKRDHQLQRERDILLELDVGLDCGRNLKTQNQKPEAVWEDQKVTEEHAAREEDRRGHDGWNRHPPLVLVEPGRDELPNLVKDVRA